MTDTLDLTPDPDGMVRWARTVLRQARPGSPDIEVARRI